MVTLLKDGLGRLFHARSQRERSSRGRGVGEDKILILLGPGNTRTGQADILVAVMGGSGRCRERHEENVNTTTTRRKNEMLLSSSRFGNKGAKARDHD